MLKRARHTVLGGSPVYRAPATLPAHAVAIVVAVGWSRAAQKVKCPKRRVPRAGGVAR